MIVIESKAGVTTYDPERKIIASTYVGRVKIDDALEHLKSVYAFHLKHNAEGSIVDLRKIHGSFAKLLSYVGDTYQDVIKSGLKCSAYVVSDDLMVNNLLKKIIAIEDPLEHKSAVFENRTEAEQWVIENLKKNFT